MGVKNNLNGDILLYLQQIEENKGILWQFLLIISIVLFLIKIEQLILNTFYLIPYSF